jgi:EAL domain-containing protein (putative c-di-GMP-specific phosphodiesterase class I)
LNQFKHWIEYFSFLKDIYLCINISVKQLLSEDFIKDLKEAVVKSEISFHNLHLEITESVFIDDNSQACQVIGIVKDLGVKISIDDFGTGYSSLKYLDQYSIDLIKLDKELIQKIGNQDKSFNIIESMLLLTTKLDIKVIAEGIEQTSQLAMLKDLKCHLGQGYLFAKPLGLEAVENYFQSLSK